MQEFHDLISALRNRRNELVRELLEIEDNLDDALPKDWEDRSSERQGDEVLEALGKHDLIELRMIDSALARAKDGTFGICKNCGSEISRARLETIPETPFCKSCAPSHAP